MTDQTPIERATQWMPVPMTLTVGEEEPKRMWTATVLDGVELASHPILDNFETCLELCQRMNDLDWTEEDYLDNSSHVQKAIETGEISTLDTPAPRPNLITAVKNWLTGKDQQ